MAALLLIMKFTFEWLQLDVAFEHSQNLNRELSILGWNSKHNFMLIQGIEPYRLNFSV